ncbi:hypothetical protein ACH4OW_19120 [Streptomyces sp. NPDC017056]|uniref:hypothetical protein n=1 Tax=Streptomyces sp. NPDC017056 TaxID=3364973 RepID=UPI0037ABCD96
MRAKRRSVIRTAAVATGVAAVLLLPAGGAFAADASDATASHAMGRKSAVLPEDGLAGVAEKIGHLPTGGLAGAAAVLGAGLGVSLHRRRESQQG